MSGMCEGTHRIQIRKAITGDSERLAELCGQLGYPTSQEQMLRRLSPILEGEDQIVFVAETAEGQVIGWVQVYTRRLLVADLHAEIGGLVVDQAQRGQGLGRLLMAHAEAWARDCGCQTVSLRSNVVREEAHRFYGALGYNLSKTQLAFRKELRGA